MKIVAFGEVMARLAPPGYQRLRQALPGTLDVTFAGAEANVLASLAMLGRESAIVTAVPQNVLGQACADALRKVGIDSANVQFRNHGRMGLYFLEAGANQRASQVVYDRSGSTISQTPADAFAWDDIFADARWFHVTGITPAISQLAMQCTQLAMQKAKSAGVTVSCDLNFRKKLWRWDEDADPRELAERSMRQLLPMVDVLVANEADCGDVLGIRAPGSDVESGQLDVQRYPDVAGQVVDQFPNLHTVGITLRESISASHNRWGGMIYRRDDRKAWFAPVGGDGEYSPYEITDIVDRVGAGDAFAAGLIYSLTDERLGDPDHAIRFAAAASCLAHSISGDFNYSTRDELESLMEGGGRGRVIR